MVLNIKEMIPFCADQGLGVIPWSPLARGLLTGKIKRPSKEELAAIFAKNIDVPLIIMLAFLAAFIILMLTFRLRRPAIAS